MKNIFKILFIIILFNSCGNVQNKQFCMEESDFKGIVESLVTTSKQGLRQNHYLNYNINSLGFKISCV